MGKDGVGGSDARETPRWDSIQLAIVILSFPDSGVRGGSHLHALAQLAADLVVILDFAVEDDLHGGGRLYSRRLRQATPHPAKRGSLCIFRLGWCDDESPGKVQPTTYPELIDLHFPLLVGSQRLKGPHVF